MTQPTNSVQNKVFLTELAIYVAQLLIFALIALLVSGFLTDEATLHRILEERINDLSLRELAATLISVFAMIGILSFIKDRTGAKFLDEIMSSVYEELPRTIYLFGSSVGGTLITLSFYLISSSKSQPGDIRLGYGTIMLALLFSIAFFFTGYICKIKAKRGPVQQPILP